LRSPEHQRLYSELVFTQKKTRDFIIFSKEKIPEKPRKNIRNQERNL